MARNRAADDPNPHGAGNGVPCRGHAKDRIEAFHKQVLRFSALEVISLEAFHKRTQEEERD